MTLCQTDVILVFASIGYKILVKKLTHGCILKITKQSVPRIGRYHCGLVTPADAHIPAHSAKKTNDINVYDRSAPPNSYSFGLREFAESVVLLRPQRSPETHPVVDMLGPLVLELGTVIPLFCSNQKACSGSEDIALWENKEMCHNTVRPRQNAAIMRTT